MLRLRVGACLSLTGRYARFGRQAAAGLAAWRELHGAAELVVEDDESDPARLAALIGGVASRCDLLLGPYSTQLLRAAAGALADRECLLWNHGGSGVAALPGRMVSVLTPASRYAEPFVARLAGDAPLCIAVGQGSFGREVAAGAEAFARACGLDVARVAPSSGPWDLFSAGTFEDDAALVAEALARPRPPRTVCSVAAGVTAFAEVVPVCEGVFGIAQWFPGSSIPAAVGPSEAAFLAAMGSTPDYPAVQVAAAAALAVHCARLGDGTAPSVLWAAAAALDTTTLFGQFRVDPVTGVQAGHETVLVRWTGGRQERSVPGHGPPGLSGPRARGDASWEAD